MSTDIDLRQCAEILALAMMRALLDGAADAAVCLLFHSDFTSSRLILVCPPPAHLSGHRCLIGKIPHFRHIIT